MNLLFDFVKYLIKFWTIRISIVLVIVIGILVLINHFIDLEPLFIIVMLIFAFVIGPGWTALSEFNFFIQRTFLLTLCYQVPHSWGFLFIKWFNFRYRYTGNVWFIEGFQPALGAGGREFEYLHPDTLKPYLLRRNRAFVFLTYFCLISL